MTHSHDPGPDEGRAVAGRLVYDPSFATVRKDAFNELVALMRDGAPRKPPTAEALRRRAYHEAMIHRRLAGVQHGLFGAKPTTHMHKAKPGPAIDWKPEPVQEKLVRIARDRTATLERADDIRQMFDRACAMGELPKTADVDLAFSMAAGSVYFKIVVTGSHPDDARAGTVATSVLDMLRKHR